MVSLLLSKGGETIIVVMSVGLWKFDFGHDCSQALEYRSIVGNLLECLVYTMECQLL